MFPAEKGGRHHSDQGIKTPIISNGAKWSVHRLLGWSEKSTQRLSDVSSQDAQKQQTNQPSGILQNKLTGNLQNCQGHGSPEKKTAPDEGITCNKSFWSQSFYKKRHHCNNRWKRTVKKGLDGKNATLIFWLGWLYALWRRMFCS